MRLNKKIYLLSKMTNSLNVMTEDQYLRSFLCLKTKRIYTLSIVRLEGCFLLKIPELEQLKI